MILVNRMRFNDKEFHNGEVIFEKPQLITKKVVAGEEDRCYNTIEMIFKDNRDITALMFAKEYLDDVASEVPCILEMLYCPYERMDREINNQMFSMKYFARILAKMNFSKVEILDPHSNVCVEQLTEAGVKVEVLDLTKCVNKVIEDFNPDYICYPDKGAKAKYTEVLASIKIPCFYGSKKRDLANNGKIVEYELVDAPDLTDKKVLIIDDICCLGGTAYNAAVEMKKLGAKEIAFYISHCEDGIFAGKILHPEACVPADDKEIVIGNNTYKPYTNTVEQLPWAGKYTIDKVYTADTLLIKDNHPNIKVIAPEVYYN